MLASLAWAPIPLVLVVTVALIGLSPAGRFEPPGLMPLLNAVFSTGISLLIAVLAARSFYHLPYHAARMACVKRGAAISYRCERDGPSGRAEFLADYEPMGEPFQTPAGSFEEWLTARYCLYAKEGGTLYRAEIDHVPWTLRRAKAEIVRNTMAADSGIELPPERPLLHYAEPLEVRVWWPERVHVPRR